MFEWLLYLTSVFFLKCISCSQGHIEPIAETAYGKCTQCPTIVLVDHCKTFVSALLTISLEKFQIKLLAADKQLSSIANLPTNEITELSLFSPANFTVTYNNNMEIVEVTRDN